MSYTHRCDRCGEIVDVPAAMDFTIPWQYTDKKQPKGVNGTAVLVGTDICGKCAESFKRWWNTDDVMWVARTSRRIGDNWII